MKLRLSGVIALLSTALLSVGASTASASFSPGEGSGPGWCAQYGGANLTSYDNVFACGVTSSSASAGITPFDFDAGFQCVELANRFLFDVWSRPPIFGESLDGQDFAATVSDDYGIPLDQDGTAGQPYEAGDIVSFNGVIDSHGVNLESSGHVAVVTNSTEDSSGNGIVTIMEENAAAVGYENLTVTKWALQAASGAYVTPSEFDAFNTGSGGGSPPPSVTPSATAYTGARSGSYGDAVTLSARLADSSTSAGLSGESVAFTLGSESCSAMTDGSGDASCLVTLSQTPGAYTVSASFAGDATYAASGDSAPFTINQAPTKTSYGGPGSAEFYQPFTASATLVDADTGAPISAETITLKLASSDSCTGMTDSTGTVSCSITPTQTPGSYSIVASFAGDPLFLASSDTESFTITKAPTTTTLRAAPAGSSTFGQPVTFTAVSASANPGAPTPTGSTAFTVDGNPAGSGALSGGSGSTATSSLSGGAHTVTASYGGDQDFLPSSGDLLYTVTCDVNISGTHQGSLTVTTTACAAPGSQIDGSVIVKPGASLDLEGASVNGALDANGGGVIRVCSSSIGGALDVKNSSGIVIIGDAAIGCAANQIAGALSVQNNSHGGEVINNTAGGSIITGGNSGPGPYPGDPTTIAGNGPRARTPLSIPIPIAPSTPPAGGPPIIPADQPAAAPASTPVLAPTPAPAALTAPASQPRPATTPPSHTPPPPAEPLAQHAAATHTLTQAHKLAAAITACEKLKKSKRAACTATAKKRYPLTPRTPIRSARERS